ncbi:MAG: VOC family protein [Candidatus Tectomicrobia bacterium]|uniref:VOC family protein n=1 Tax=Tectimicrobiota bacterium TaxID=2528274 RepID=A0A937W0P2_UNCTE|nr:VOC family protein [Candidatus Tectomicrobia bacterium]
MAILLDHLIVPSHHPVDAAQSLAHILGVPWDPEGGHFTPVYVNNTLTLDFAEREHFDRHHYCFHVSDAEFDGIFARVRAAGIVYRSTPRGPDDMQLNTRLGGRNFYWNDSDGHNWEVLTVSYARPQATAAAG